MLDLTAPLSGRNDLALLVWKRFRRPSKFGIYGFARSHVYQRLWYGRKVLHFRFKFKRMKKAT